MELLNYTPHDLDVMDTEGNVKTIPSHGVARVSVKSQELEPVCGFPVSTQVFGKVEGLPEYKEGTYIIVSLLVRQQAKGRKDLLSPDTGPSAVREEGKILYVKGFVYGN